MYSHVVSVERQKSCCAKAAERAETENHCFIFHGYLVFEECGWAATSLGSAIAS